jgi:hypothetical protein
MIESCLQVKAAQKQNIWSPHLRMPTPTPNPPPLAE